MVLERDRFWWTLYGIGVITVVSGIVQCLAPGALLQVLSPDVTLASKHFLMITGVLTASFGALLMHALVRHDAQHVAVLWTGIQKILAAAAVGLAIQDDIFSMYALAAGMFDLIAGVMIVAYWYWIKQLQQEEAEAARGDV
ncbi:MAG TPA: hypothetical protein VNL69_11630 [Bacteroidota bacterium]|nr:hypothetical protein [Bacteroidota bacterium]